jgi:hypothetical protein
MMTFKEVGYDGMVQPDHNVASAGDSGGGRGRGAADAATTGGEPGEGGPRGGGGGAYTAFVYGYIKALIQLADLA